MDKKKKDKKSTSKKKPIVKSKKVPKKLSKAIKIVTPSTEIKDVVDDIESFEQYGIPSESKQMNQFMIKNKLEMTERVIDAIRFAVDKNLELIEVFQFTNTNFVVTISRDNFYENVKNILDYYISKELYEFCGRVKELEAKLLEHIPKDEIC